MNQSYQDILIFARSLAKQAGEIMLAESRQLKLDYKQSIELVTQADIKVDQFLCEQITQHFPAQQIISEESTPNWQVSDDSVWVIDPIDGTVNYAHQHHQSAVSIAFYEHGMAQVGVVYNPFSKELFSALKGQGAWLKQTSIQCSEKTELRRALVATGFPYHKNDTQVLAQRMSLVLEQCADIRRLGSAALDICWVACGRLDAYYETVSLWDCAAARLIAQEAGAKAGSFAATPALPADWQCEHLLISTPALYAPLAEILAASL